MIKKPIVLTIILIVFSFSIIPFTLAQIDDTNPPHLVEFDFEPKIIDTSTGPATITFTMRLTDDVSGVREDADTTWFESTNSSQSTAEFLYDAADRVSGDQFDGIYVEQLILPQFSASGVWKINSMKLQDGVENTRSLNYDDLVALGFSAEFTNTGVGDTDPPHLVEFDFEPKSIDTSFGPAIITFTMRLTDNLSGVREDADTTWFESTNSGQSTAEFLYDATDRVSGNQFDGVYVEQLILPQFSASGVWKINGMNLRDGVENTRSLNSTDLTVLGFPSEFVNVGIEDIDPPHLVEFDFVPKVIDTSIGPATITFTMRLTDDLSGVRDQADVTYFRSSTGQSKGMFLYDTADRTSGDQFDGYYLENLTLPQFSELGIWKMNAMHLRDSAENTRSLNNDNLIEIGLPAHFVNARYVSTDTKITIESNVPGINTIISIPSGALTETTPIAISRIENPLNIGNYKIVGNQFDISAYEEDGNPKNSFTFSSPVTITILYEDEDLISQGVDEDSLELKYWDRTVNSWKPANQSCIVPEPPIYDTDNNMLHTKICHLSIFVLLAEKKSIFLPIIVKN